MNDWRLFGTSGSLYTGKARCYLRKQHIDFTEFAPATPEFQALMPIISRWIIPVVQTPDSTILQDGSVIIDHIEAKGLARLPALPETPLHRVVTLLFELFGGEGMLRAAMHYRWNFDAVNLPFVRDDFVAGLAPVGAPETMRDQVFTMASTRMRAAMAGFGVTPESIPLIEVAHAEFLALFAAHLATTPYLLGGRPTYGDYGLVAPLFAHLGRDPVPLHLMQRTARSVFRWTERMNAPESLADGLGPADGGLFGNDAIPETLAAMLRFIATDYLPEIIAHVGFANAWLAQQGDITGTSGLANKSNRMIGRAAFEWRGVPIETMVMPYRFYLLQRVQDAHAAAPPEARARIDALFAATGLAPLLTLKTLRRVERRDHLEIWGPLLG